MSSTRRTIRDGLVVGLIGYASVAVFYSIFDLLASRGALYTVDLLGKAVFRGLRDPGVLLLPMQPDVTAILLYNAMHLVIALVIGLVVVALVAQSEAHPSRRTLVLFTIVAGFVVTVFAVGVLTAAMRPVLPWWSIVVANAFATLLAGWYLLHRHPGLWHRMSPLSISAA